VQSYLDIQAVVTKRFEKCVLTGYPDQGGIPTWGWGHTGPEVRIGQVIPQQRADDDFERDQAVADAKLKRHVSPAAFERLSEHEKAAVLDFVFNTGGGPEPSDPKCWTIWKDVEAGQLDDVVAQFDRFIYIHIDGKPVTSNGLKNRRNAEKTLWNTGDQEAAVAAANAGGETVSSGATRVLPTPPETTAPKAFAKTSLGLKLGQLVGGVSLTGLAGKVATPDNQAQLSSLHDTVSSHASELGHFGPALVAVLGAGLVIMAGAQFLVHIEQQQKAKL